MITLNTDKGIVKIETWDEVIERPGYVSNLDSTTEKLKEIIGNYVFKEKVNCGLKKCRTPHNKGYLVVTESGQETNIGKDCGQNYFGVDFQHQRKIFDSLVQDTNNRERLWGLSFQIEEVDKRIEDVDKRPYGVKWAYTWIKSFQQALPSAVKNRLHRMVKARNGNIEVDVMLSEPEIKDLEAIQGIKLPRPQYKTEVVDVLDGISALYKENDIRVLLVDNIKRDFETFKTLDIDQLKSKDLKRWAKWASTIDTTFEQIESSLSAHQRLLKVENMSKLAIYIEKKEDKTKFISELASNLKALKTAKN